LHVRRELISQWFYLCKWNSYCCESCPVHERAARVSWHRSNVRCWSVAKSDVEMFRFTRDFFGRRRI